MAPQPTKSAGHKLGAILAVASTAVLLFVFYVLYELTKADLRSVSDAPVFQLASEIALGHHERWDGSGYPNGKAGKEIPESARIVALADVFDALTSVRPYKKAWSVDDAIAHIQKESGAHFDPDLVKLFVGTLPQVVAVKAKWDAVAQAS